MENYGQTEDVYNPYPPAKTPPRLIPTSFNADQPRYNTASPNSFAVPSHPLPQSPLHSPCQNQSPFLNPQNTQYAAAYNSNNYSSNANSMHQAAALNGAYAYGAQQYVVPPPQLQYQPQPFPQHQHQQLYPAGLPTPPSFYQSPGYSSNSTPMQSNGAATCLPAQGSNQFSWQSSAGNSFAFSFDAQGPVGVTSAGAVTHNTAASTASTGTTASNYNTHRASVSSVSSNNSAHSQQLMQQQQQQQQQSQPPQPGSGAEALCNAWNGTEATMDEITNLLGKTLQAGRVQDGAASSSSWRQESGNTAGNTGGGVQGGMVDPHYQQRPGAIPRHLSGLTRCNSQPLSSGSHSSESGSPRHRGSSEPVLQSLESGASARSARSSASRGNPQSAPPRGSVPLPSQPLQPDDAHTDSSGGGTHSINARAHAPTLAIAKKWRSKVKWDQLSKPREERPQNPYQGSKPELPEPVMHFVFKRAMQGVSEVIQLPNGMVKLMGEPLLYHGDQYMGGMLNDSPHNHGKYTWANGDHYAGEWMHGLQHGTGRYTWKDGSHYEGDWEEGIMKGRGTYYSSSGSVYSGSWQFGLMDGLGKQQFCNGDAYDGLWVRGIPEGPGRYSWKDGSEYNGEMANGERDGRGTFVHSSGYMFFGEFVEGLEHGRGVHTNLNFSFFDGVWVDGRRDGAGVFFPPPEDREAKVLLKEYSDGEIVREEPAGELFLEQYKLPPMHVQRHAHRVKVDEPDVSETRNIHSSLDLAATPAKVNQIGDVVYMGTSAYDFMLNLQLGIRVNVMKMMSSKDRAVVPSDFEDTEDYEQFFPRLGSANTPPHPSKDFKFKNYYPMVFHSLRKHFKIELAEYVQSLCSDASLREMSSPGKSGAGFYISHNDRYFVKTLTKEEMRMLRIMLPKYYTHCATYKHTMLTRLYGLHRVDSMNGGAPVRVVVMGNLLCSSAPIHRRFDLKGSTQGRFTRKTLDELKPTSVLKDLDLDTVFELPDKWYDIYDEQLRADCKLLEEVGVIDYSLLVGVHFRDAKQNPDLVRALGKGFQEDDLHDVFVEQQAQMDVLVKTGNKLSRRKSVIDMEDRVATALNYRPWTKKDRRSAMNEKQSSDKMRKMGLTSLTTETLAKARGEESTLGICMASHALPRRIMPWPEEAGMEPRPQLLKQPQHAVIYFGIIDFLQEYNMRKKLEHHGKSLKFDKSSISVTNPQAYAKRFRGYMQKVFIKRSEGE
eukprot:CAMPEP_0114241896 /NCGR_PEP_ID=MMETSP0058-20121206/9877_1 /TAXON_ID=36894 /ORGANISM="Pyramimonas parkeae, CCMP726" /LENGTH=1218 /DNA_ID=CAMNT_0001354453 /DNA_START=137 /DNA_END=3793 /DNA_ORIENTATION=+